MSTDKHTALIRMGYTVIWHSAESYPALGTSFLLFEVQCDSDVVFKNVSQRLPCWKIAPQLGDVTKSWALRGRPSWRCWLWNRLVVVHRILVSLCLTVWQLPPEQTPVVISSTIRSSYQRLNTSLLDPNCELANFSLRVSKVQHFIIQQKTRWCLGLGQQVFFKSWALSAEGSNSCCWRVRSRCFYHKIQV